MNATSHVLPSQLQSSFVTTNVHIQTTSKANVAKHKLNIQQLRIINAPNYMKTNRNTRNTKISQKILFEKHNNTILCEKGFSSTI